jgi:hypothetical protein
MHARGIWKWDVFHTSIRTTITPLWCEDSISNYPAIWQKLWNVQNIYYFMQMRDANGFPLVHRLVYTGTIVHCTLSKWRFHVSSIRHLEGKMKYNFPLTQLICKWEIWYGNEMLCIHLGTILYWWWLLSVSPRARHRNDCESEILVMIFSLWIWRQLFSTSSANVNSKMPKKILQNSKTCNFYYFSVLPGSPYSMKYNPLLDTPLLWH